MVVNYELLSIQQVLCNRVVVAKHIESIETPAYVVFDDDSTVQRLQQLDIQDNFKAVYEFPVIFYYCMRLAGHMQLAQLGLQRVLSSTIVATHSVTATSDNTYRYSGKLIYGD